jgi:uncharacterized protein
MGTTSKILQRVDSWYNALTGLGNALRDKAANTYFMRQTRLADDALENLFHGEDLAARICQQLPHEALRKGFFLGSDENNQDLANKLEEYQERLKFPQRLYETAVWSRVLGGACLYLGIDDGRPDDQPVNEEAIRALTFVAVLDKRSLYPTKWYEDITRYGEPEAYRISAPPVQHGATRPSALQTGAQIHESRLLRLDGTLCSLRRQQLNNGWGDSVLEKVHTVLRDFGSSWQAVGHLMQDAAQGVFKVQGLTEMIRSGESDLLNARMELVDMGRSIARSIMVDADQEDFHREAYAFTGIPDILKLFMVRLAGAAGMPVAVLMGSRVLSSGLNSSEAEDTRRWYDSIQAYQQHTLASAIGRFWRLVFAARDFDFAPPGAWTVSFHRLWQMTDKEQAELEKLIAEKDKIYIDAEVVLPEEIALSRYGSGEFSAATQIDIDAREEMREAELELAVEKAGEDPIAAAAAMAQATAPEAGDAEEPAE